MSEFRTIAEVSQVPAERGLTVHVGELEFALFNLDGVIHVLDGLCPHRGGPLGEGRVSDGLVACPLHGWEFDVRTGACPDNPERPARCIASRVVDGKVQIEL